MSDPVSINGTTQDILACLLVSFPLKGLLQANRVLGFSRDSREQLLQGLEEQIHHFLFLGWVYLGHTHDVVHIDVRYL